MDREKMLKDIFEEMKKICYAEVNGVEYNSDIEGCAAIDWGTKTISINPRAFEYLGEKGMSEEEIIKGLLQHEYLGHKAQHPYDVKRGIVEAIALQEIGAKCIDFVRCRFNDIVANLKVWNTYGGEELLKLYKNSECSCKFDIVEKLLYQVILGDDLGVDKEDLYHYVEELKEKINFLSGTPVKSVRECRGQIKRFYRIIEPLLEEFEKERPPQLSGEQSVFELSEKTVEKAIRELIEGREISPEQAKKFLKEYGEGKQKQQREKSIGGGPNGEFSNNPDIYANKVIYNILSENYRLKIKKLLLKKKGGLCPDGHASWEVSDPVEDIDPFTSYGIIAPGITKKIKRAPTEYFGEKEKVPDLVLLLDDSGSMPNPVEDISEAVLSSFVVAKNYVRNGGKVAPIRFSDRTTTSEFLGEEDKILEELLKFRGGGDTRVELDKVEEVVKDKRKEELDTIIITDGLIGNRDEVVDYLSQFNRSFMFEIGKDGEPYKEKKVMIYPISKEEDIAKIVIDEVI